jgi:hypothetical protein
MKLSRGFARFNKRATNRIQGLYAWLLPPWAVILHRGRRSGREYRTPLFAFRRDRTTRSTSSASNPSRTSRAYLDLVESSTRQAQSFGINGIPAFLLDRRLIVLGAHPLETFRRAFAHPEEG